MMEANEFISKIKANNSAKDITDLVKVYDEYKVILEQVASKDRAPFSLNVLCILCRNLEKAPQWRERIDNKDLLKLSIDCVRETRQMERGDRVKTLASVYHIHKHVVRQSHSNHSMQILRMLLGLPRFCSASGMFAEARVDGFAACMREKAASLLSRVRGSTNTILAAIAEKLDGVIYKHSISILVKLNKSSIPPELVLKISYMPFEVNSEHLLQEYSKTYWNLLVDQLSYIERLRTKIPIIKLLPKLTEHLLKIVEIYDTVLFCTTIILFIVKKLHQLYNEKHSKEINQTFAQIFAKLSTKDTKAFKTLKHTELIEIYVKINECLYIIAENASKTSFKDSPLEAVVRACINIVGHSPDLFHCLQTFYSNSFCSILTPNTHINYSENVLNSLLLSFETTERLGTHWVKAVHATYPFLNQFMRLYIEFNVANAAKKPWKDNFNVQIQNDCFKVILALMERLKNCDQLLKCDNCQVSSGLHDSLRLSFMVKHFITVSLSQNLLITEMLPQASMVIDKQYEVLDELRELGCVNYEKCFRKLQTDIHNTAISLNKAKYYEFSVKLFNTYIKNEIKELSEAKNISRALYNKSICELDSKLYNDALIDAFLSLAFSQDLSSEKYMSLVMDIKAKELKSRSDDEEETNVAFQLVSVVDAWEMSLEKQMYGDVSPFMKGLLFSELLAHEFVMYSKLWPSVMPIAGVWRSLLELSKGKYEFTDEKVQATQMLYSIIVQTPTVVRAICGEHFKGVVAELVYNMDGKELSPDEKIVFASLLFLKAEFDLEQASQEYSWKYNEPKQSPDPDQVPATRTIPQEFTASKAAVLAVSVLTELAPDFNTVTDTRQLEHSLQIYQVYVQYLLHLARDVEALQLAYHCCAIADCVEDHEAYVRNAGTLLYHSSASDQLQAVMQEAARRAAGVSEATSLVFICDAAMYHSRSGSIGLAAKLVQVAQDRILAAYEADPDINLELAVGRLLEAQTNLCKGSGPSVLSAVNGAQRHYLFVVNPGTKWHQRRLRSLTVTVHCLLASTLAVSTLSSLRMLNRARAAAACVLPRASAVGRASLYVHITDVHAMDDAQIKIDYRLKHFLGLQPSNETQPYYVAADSKITEQYTPKTEIETMLENLVFKKSQISPSVPCVDVPAFKMPDFFNHSAKCGCYVCCLPICYILACQTCGLEASVYFRAGENDIARNYFNGVVKMFNFVEKKLKSVKNRYLEVHDEFLVDAVMNNYWEKFRMAKVKILIDLAYFELKNLDYVVADAHIVEIHEILQELKIVDHYVNNEIMNLMICSAQLRKTIKIPEELGLESEFQALKLSPVPVNQEPLMTPISKSSKPPKLAKVIVEAEELPQKRKAINKINFDDCQEEKEPKKTKKPEFKVPIPVAAKHVLEAATPRTRSKPKIIITQPSEDAATPNTTKLSEFSTPKDFTPEQFFTPMTSVKTYTTKSLRRNIVKNLEEEFSMPSTKENKQANNVGDAIKEKLSGKKTSVKENVGVKEKVGVKENISVKEKGVEVSTREKSVKGNLEKKVKETSKEKPSVSLDVPRRSKKKVENKSLKRATSPGKLCKEQREPPKDAKGRMLRRKIKLSLDKDDDFM